MEGNKVSLIGKFLKKEELSRDDSVSDFYSFAVDSNVKNKRENEHRYRFRNSWSSLWFNQLWERKIQFKIKIYFNLLI